MDWFQYPLLPETEDERKSFGNVGGTPAAPATDDTMDFGPPSIQAQFCCVQDEMVLLSL